MWGAGFSPGRIATMGSGGAGSGSSDPEWASTTLLIQKGTSSQAATDADFASVTLLIQKGSS